MLKMNLGGANCGKIEEIEEWKKQKLTKARVCRSWCSKPNCCRWFSSSERNVTTTTYAMMLLRMLSERTVHTVLSESKHSIILTLNEFI